MGLHKKFIILLCLHLYNFRYNKDEIYKCRHFYIQYIGLGIIIRKNLVERSDEERINDRNGFK